MDADRSRRRFLAGMGAGLAASLSGCLDVLAGGAPAEFGASPAQVGPEALAEAQYAEYRVEQAPVTRSVGAFGVTRQVRVTNWLAEYDQALDLGLLGLGRLQAAVFAALSTPKVEVLGRTFNPVGDMSTDELAELIQEHYGAVGDVQPEEALDASVLGSQTTLTRYTAEARLLETGTSVDVYLYLTEAVEAGEDFVVCVAVHPRFAGRRESTVRTLLSGVEHQTRDGAGG